MSIAIGKAGQNVRLASKLTGYELDIESGEGRDRPTPKPEIKAEEAVDLQEPKPAEVEATPVAEPAPEQPEPKKAEVSEKPVEKKKPTKPKRRDDIEAGLLDAIDSHGE